MIVDRLAALGLHARVLPGGTGRYLRGVPPVVNDAASVDVQRAAVVSVLGADALAESSSQFAAFERQQTSASVSRR